MNNLGTKITKFICMALTSCVKRLNWHLVCKFKLEFRTGYQDNLFINICNDGCIGFSVLVEDDGRVAAA